MPLASPSSCEDCPLIPDPIADIDAVLALANTYKQKPAEGELSHIPDDT